ncbi:MAG: hypothetical protein ABWK53_08075 [Anaerolineales bacterium]
MRKLHFFEQNDIRFTAKAPKRQRFAEFAKCAWRLDSLLAFSVSWRFGLRTSY